MSEPGDGRFEAMVEAMRPTCWWTRKEAGMSKILADLDLDWFTAEVVAYFKVFDYHEVWKPSGARALGEWLVLHSGPHSVSDQPHNAAIQTLERKRG